MMVFSAVFSFYEFVRKYGQGAVYRGAFWRDLFGFALVLLGGGLVGCMVGVDLVY